MAQGNIALVTIDRTRIKSVEILSKRWGTLTSTRLDYRRRDGGWDEQLREVYDHGHAAAIIPYDPQRDTVLLVRQFRYVDHMLGGEGDMIEVAPAFSMPMTRKAASAARRWRNSASSCETCAIFTPATPARAALPSRFIFRRPLCARRSRGRGRRSSGRGRGYRSAGMAVGGGARRPLTKAASSTLKPSCCCAKSSWKNCGNIPVDPENLAPYVPPTFQGPSPLGVGR